MLSRLSAILAVIPKGYIYAAMAFSALVEGLNMLARKANSKRRSQAPHEAKH
ncbi:hypothetical protein GCM10010985_16400 [Caballeronia grimmiae]|uniref:Transposase n=1 Tax=Caballeronia grimmiae TaxID=1071679 RepID=A0ABQ1RDF4_9BURK|nr:hypothetical protein GCM10010985_16400 [Caballeronia grimmiae]